MATTSPQPQPGFARRHWKLLTLLLLVVLPVGVLVGWTYAALHVPPYSAGPRTGYNQKISRKGWVCKTWEGELAVSNVAGQAPQVFLYSVRDDAVAERLVALSGQRVTLTTEQRKGIPTHCFGDTEYFATAVQPAGEAGFPAPFPGAGASAVPGTAPAPAVPPAAPPASR